MTNSELKRRAVQKHNERYELGLARPKSQDEIRREIVTGVVKEVLKSIR